MKKLFLCILLSIIFVSCNRSKPAVFDESEPLALAPDVQWALVIDPYAAYRSENSWSGEVKGHCRKGDILRVEGTSFSNNDEYWYYFENGWLPDSSISLYSNRLKAQTAAGRLK